MLRRIHLPGGSIAALAVFLVIAFAASTSAALADTKEANCSGQWCKITCATVNADAHCEGHGGSLATCTCRGETHGGSTHVKCTTGDTCDKECEDGTRPGGNCNLGKPQCVCTGVRH
jgi:hypothetical protein